MEKTKALLIMEEMSEEIFALAMARELSEKRMASVGLNSLWHELLTILADANMLYEEDK